MTIEDAQIECFRAAFCAVAEAQMGAQQQVAQIEIDAETAFAALTRQTIEQINSLGPFGCGNRRPILCASDVRVAAEPRLMGATGRHLSVDLEQNGVRLRAVAFGGADWHDDLKAAIGESISVAFQPVLNQFRGRVSVEMHLADWRRDD